MGIENGRDVHQESPRSSSGLETDHSLLLPLLIAVICCYSSYFTGLLAILLKKLTTRSNPKLVALQAKQRMCATELAKISAIDDFATYARKKRELSAINDEIAAEDIRIVEKSGEKTGTSWWVIPAGILGVVAVGGLTYFLIMKTRSRKSLRSTPAPLHTTEEGKKLSKLEEFGYRFKNGKLVTVETGDPFEFEVKKGDRAYNQKHYEQLGELITDHIFELLKEEAKLLQITVPLPPENGEATGFFFASVDALTKDKLLILIHGSGVVRAGQWSRRLIINEGLDRGTQLPYIKRGKERGFGIIVLNTNYNRAENADGVLKRIRGNEDGVAHSLYVWRKFISKSKASKIAIVAHSAGGYDTVKLADGETEDFKNRVFAVCFTDSAHISGRNEGFDFLKKVGRNWVTSDKPLDTVLLTGGRDIDRYSAGAMKHEETSPAAIDAVFKYMDARLNPKKRSNGDSEDDDKAAKSQKMTKESKEDL